MRGRFGAFVLGLSLAGAYILGCATSRVVQPSAQAQLAPWSPLQRWEYFCADGFSPPTIMERANAAGREGWEMVAGVGSHRVTGIWCFKRPRR